MLLDMADGEASEATYRARVILAGAGGFHADENTLPK